MITVPTRLDLIKMFPGGIGAEVGVCKGHFAIEMLNHAHLKKLFCIDAWAGQTPGEPEITPEMHEANLEETRHHLRGHLPYGRVEIIRARSLEAARNWSGPELDFVYIDAAHDYVSVMDDLINWSMRLKNTGSLLGHDYTKNDMAQKYGFGVIGAVTDFCNNFGWELTHLSREDFASFRLQPKAWTGAEL